MVFNRFSEPCNNRKLNAWNHTCVVIVHGQYNKQNFVKYFTPVLFDFCNLVRGKKLSGVKGASLFHSNFVLKMPNFSFYRYAYLLCNNMQTWLQKSFHPWRCAVVSSTKRWKPQKSLVIQNSPRKWGWFCLWAHTALLLPFHRRRLDTTASQCGQTW